MSPCLRLVLILTGFAVLLAVIWWRSGFWTFLVLALLGLAIIGVGLILATRRPINPLDKPGHGPDTALSRRNHTEPK